MQAWRRQADGRPCHLDEEEVARGPRQRGLYKELATYHRPDWNVLLHRNDSRSGMNDVTL